jgi:hypothetical protein
MRAVSNLIKSPLPQKKPFIIALGLRVYPLFKPNPVENGLWEYAYDYTIAFINGIKQLNPPTSQQLISTDVDILIAAVNRLNISIN